MNIINWALNIGKRKSLRVGARVSTPFGIATVTSVSVQVKTDVPIGLRCPNTGFTCNLNSIKMI